MKEYTDVTRFIERLKRGAVKKSVIASIIVSFFSLAVFAGVGWYFGFKEVWAYPVVFAGVAVISAPLFYFLKYRKTGREVALAIDRLGLEERMLTMESLKGEDTYIARRQREDTMNALKLVSEKRFSLALSTALLVCLAIALPLGAGFTTVSALAAEGVLPFGREVTKGIPAKYSLVYTVSEGGSLQGITKQYVTAGEDASYVIAVADDGYEFVKWSDNKKEAVRLDKEVDGDVKVKAIFERLDDSNADEKLFGPNDKPDNGNGSGSERGNDDAPPSNGSQGSEGKDGPPQDGAGGGPGDDSDKVIDGNKSYLGELENARNDAIDRINSDPNMDSRYKDLANDYFSKIDK